MEKCFDEKKIAKLTGTAVQDDETFKAEGGFVPERDQFYFEMAGIDPKKVEENTKLINDLINSMKE